MTRTLTIVPRWAGHSDSDFYPWLIRESPPGFDAVRALDMPEPEAAHPWRLGLRAHRRHGNPRPRPARCCWGTASDARRCCATWRSCLPGARVDGVLLVAGWWSVDKPWDSLRPWTDTPVDLARVRAASRRFVVLLSDNDPFTSDFRENGRLWAGAPRCRGGARCPGARHFNGEREPAVLDALRLHFPGPLNP